ncbi:hypothetical protein [Klebsiella phage vB_KshKPC-M]|nr:hypothetical protein [Klebsiella phage vB_KshKPC-M]
MIFFLPSRYTDLPDPESRLYFCNSIKSQRATQFYFASQPGLRRHYSSRELRGILRRVFEI